ncbi:MAG: NAD-binding protein [Arcobacteraceae bacterium]|jgi:voltage-gated potassium channel|nr:NAD-binding protein [Arcobacteraceae bacterium]
MSNHFSLKVVKLAYSIESSNSYHRFRTFLVNILENEYSRYKKFFDLFIVFLVITTVGILVYEVRHAVDENLIYYEYFAVTVFIIEYIGRYILSYESHKQIIKDYEESQYLNIPFKLSHSLKIIFQEKISYVFSLSSIIDILAILPSYRPLRILRIFLLFRLFKVLRYSSSLHQFIKIFVEKKTELIMLLGLYLLVVFFAAIVFYIYEGGDVNHNVNSFADSVYWSFITVATIGYGDITPHSEAGRLVVLILIVAGIAVAAFFTAIVTSAMSDKLDLIKKTKTLTSINKSKKYILVCGFGKAGHMLVENLLKNSHRVLVIDPNPEVFHQAELHSVNIIKDDASDIDLLEKIGLNTNIKSVVILTEDDTINLSIILAIRSLNPNIQIISKCNRQRTKEKLKIAGANELIMSNDLLAKVAIGFIKAPIAYEAIDDILTDYKGAVINEVEIFQNSLFVGKKLSDISFDRFNLTFVGLTNDKDKKKFIFNPNKESITIREKDFLVVIGYEKTIAEFKKYLQRAK